MLQDLLTHGLTTGLLGWLRGARNPEGRPTADSGVALTFSNTYRVVVVLLSGLTTAFLAGAVVVFRADPSAQAVAGAIFGAAWLGTMYGFYDAFGVRLTASSRGLTSTSWLSGERHLYWERIDRVTYNALGNWYRFRSDQGWSVRVSIYRSGLRSFAELVAANIQRSQARTAPTRFYTDTA